ncbi:ABC transporter ATP-binding protein [Cohnella faecalis]|uniref:ABC transporter ATP-binding protein n=2 Tax=Cohnella faecalis TaxID=2315694 RepID=A0A398D201_9BACL|nr:ABC transporter ATP-binding protein [Cohnella faecalis]RIE05134.1 ABC transporter ATP-binding protein [Cohnella faecalis]
MAGDNHLLDVQKLKTWFRTEKGSVAAVDGVSFHVREGEFIGIVGESGCGKSVTSQSIMRLLDEKRRVRYEGEVNYRGENLLQLPPSRMRSIRGNEISMIFQDPMSSLNPVFTIGKQLTEAITLHERVSRRAARERAIELLRLTGIPAPERRMGEYPHQLSGGMRQRIMIAIALACRPALLIADEPTTALDVTIQAQILDLLGELNRSYGMSVLLITHDLGVVAEVCSRVLVMYLGQIVEEAPVHELFARPRHPYTKSLMRAVPTLDSDRSQELPAIDGSVPTLYHIPPGCRFAPRCPYADERCTGPEQPPVVQVGEGHSARCWHAESLMEGGARDDDCA